MPDLCDVFETFMRLVAYQFAVWNRVDLIIFPECALTGYPPRDIAACGKNVRWRIRMEINRDVYLVRLIVRKNF